MRHACAETGLEPTVEPTALSHRRRLDPPAELASMDPTIPEPLSPPCRSRYRSSSQPVAVSAAIGQWICSKGAGPSTSGGALSCCPTRSIVNW